MTSHSINAPAAMSQPRDPLAALDIAALIGGAATLRPERVAFYMPADTSLETMSFLGLEQRSAAMAASWRDLGLVAGERLLIVTGASAAGLVAFNGGLRAGLDVALAPPHLTAEELAAYAAACGAVAIAGEPACGSIDVADTLLRAAALADRVRFVAALAHTSIDGAVPLDPMAANAGAMPESNFTSSSHARVITRDISGRIHIHRQQTLVAAALDFVTRAQIGTGAPIISTILPSSFAGLAAGPLASLISGAALLLHNPFDSARLATQLNEIRPVHLIAPAMLGDDFVAAGIANPDNLTSLVLLTRFRQMPVDLPQVPAGGALQTSIPLIDIYGIGEVAAVAEHRHANGMRIAPLTTQHVLNLDGSDVVVARRKLHYLAVNGRLDAVVAIEGAAISQTGENELAGGDSHE